MNFEFESLFLNMLDCSKLSDYVIKNQILVDVIIPSQIVFRIFCFYHLWLLITLLNGTSFLKSAHWNQAIVFSFISIDNFHLFTCIVKLCRILLIVNSNFVDCHLSPISWSFVCYTSNQNWKHLFQHIARTAYQCFGIKTYSKHPLTASTGTHYSLS